MSADGRKITYLNHAAGSWPKPPEVTEAVAAALSEMPDHGGRTSGPKADPVSHCRACVAALLGVPDPTQVVLTGSATHALCVAILGLRPRPRRIVTTALEHNSVLRPLHHLARDYGCDLAIAGLGPDGRLDRDHLMREIRAGADLVALTHASNVTGEVIDPRRVFEDARARGARTLLDASQSVGLVAIDPFALGADMVALAGHKGLMGPAGTGALWIAPGVEVEPLLPGGTGIRSESLLQPSEMPLRLESGTPAAPSLAGLAAGIDWVRKQGTERSDVILAAGRMMRAALRAVRGVRVYGPADAEAPVVSLRIDGWDAAETGLVLFDSFGVVCRTGLHCAPLAAGELAAPRDGTVRLSVGGPCPIDDVRTAVDAVTRMAA